MSLKLIVLLISWVLHLVISNDRGYTPQFQMLILASCSKCNLILSLTNSTHLESFDTQYGVGMSIWNHSQALIELPYFDLFHCCCSKMLAVYCNNTVDLLIVSIDYDVVLAVFILCLIHLLMRFASFQA